MAHLIAGAAGRARVCRTQKPAERVRRILFIDAVHEVARERAQSFLTAEHQQRILAAYRKFADDPGFAKVATVDEVLEKDGNLAIPRYVRTSPVEPRSNGAGDLRKIWLEFDASGREFWQQMDTLVEVVDGVTMDEPDV